jgi:hypothetical protein
MPSTEVTSSCVRGFNVHRQEPEEKFHTLTSPHSSPARTDTGSMQVQVGGNDCVGWTGSLPFHALDTENGWLPSSRASPTSLFHPHALYS